MKKLFMVMAVVLVSATVMTSCKKDDKTDPTPDPTPTTDLTSIDAFNALILADYHSVVDTAAPEATRLLYEAQATFTKCLDEYEGDPVMATFYTVVELQYGDSMPFIVCHKIMHDCATGEKTVITKNDQWFEDAFMAPVPLFSLRDAFNILKRNNKVPHLSVVTLREDILWKPNQEFDFPQYIFGTSLYVDSMTGIVTDNR